MIADTIQSQLADMERELNALASSQTLAPRQISTYSHSVAVVEGAAHYIAVFPSGVKLFQAFSTNALLFSVGVSGNNIDLHAYRSPGSPSGTLTLVSLGEFSFVG